MSWQHLVCANCSGLVAEGRCSVCRQARAEIHGNAFRTALLLLVGLLAALVGVLVLDLARAAA